MPIPPNLLRRNTRLNRPLDPIVKPQNTLLALVIHRHRVQLGFDYRLWAPLGFFRLEFVAVLLVARGAETAAAVGRVAQSTV